jgi:hypothetical protein
MAMEAGGKVGREGAAEVSEAGAWAAASRAAGALAAAARATVAGMAAAWTGAAARAMEAGGRAAGTRARLKWVAVTKVKVAEAMARVAASRQRGRCATMC